MSEQITNARLTLGQPGGKLLPSSGGAPENSAQASASGAFWCAMMSDKSWRKWYCTREWAALRRSVFARDKYRCQICGRLCHGRGNAPHAPVADHVKPHKGDPSLYWDEANVQTLCKQCHDGHKQSLERGGRVIGLDGWPLEGEGGGNL